MSDIVIDTSIFINHIRGTSRDLQLLKEESIFKKFRLLVPHMVISELYAGEEVKRKIIRQEIEKILSNFGVVGLTEESAKIAGDLMRIYKQIPDPIDLMIAAIALEQDAEVATHNVKHFKQIRGLKLFDFSKITKRN